MNATLTIDTISVTINEGARGVQIGESDADKADLSLLSLNYHKKIYQPGIVIAKLQLSKASIAMQKVIAFFEGKSVTLRRGTGSDAPAVASDYYIYKVLPEYKRVQIGENESMLMEVTLYCYSRDHKLTLEPYCKMYVNKKLCGLPETKGAKEKAQITGIVEDELDGGILKTAGFTTDTLQYKNLHFLKYLYSYQVEGQTNPSIGEREFIQPYLIQYNESFYDFLTRTANRCGEFVYHEKGVLHIGLHETKNPRTIHMEDTYSCRFRSVADPIIQSDQVYVNGMDLGKKLKGTGKYADPDSTYFSYDELPIEEYFGMVFAENGFSTYKDEIVPKFWNFILDTLNDVFSSATYGDIAGAFIGANLAATTSGKSDCDTKNEIGFNTLIKDASVEQKETKTLEKKILFIKNKYDTIANRTLYGSWLDIPSKEQNYLHAQNLNAKFYQFIEKSCRNVENTLIEVDVNINETTPYYIGEEVNFVASTGNGETKDSQSCIVIEVQEDLMPAGRQHLVLAPKLSVKVKKYIKNPSEKDKKKTYPLEYFCPPAVVPFVRKVGTQRAFVAQNGDPQGYGRLCIRYPWQKSTDAPSPWIRMAVPFAPNNAPNGAAGFFFEPTVGDEVLVDYENGNIEHPMIIGSLFTNRNKAPKSSRASIEDTLATCKDRRITSEKGHSISFTDTDKASDFMTGFVPGYEVLSTFVGPFADISFGKDDDISGGISIGDKWGMYKIAASATERKITVKSPFGNVSISAFTGISISAPNGDIKISGKNVTISAGNEVKIVSGKNIDEKQKSGWDYFDLIATASAGAVVGKFLAPLTDFSLLRTAVESILKPVAGTMTIQSGRYLLLTAGGGKAEIPNKGLSLTGVKKVEEDVMSKKKLGATITLISTQATTWMTDLRDKYENIQQKLTYIEGMNQRTKLQKSGMDDILSEVGKSTKDYTAADLKYKDGVSHSMSDDTFLCSQFNDLRAYINGFYEYCDKIRSGEKVGLASNNDKCFIKELQHVLKKSGTGKIDTLTDKLNQWTQTKLDKHVGLGNLHWQNFYRRPHEGLEEIGYMRQDIITFLPKVIQEGLEKKVDFKKDVKLYFEDIDNEKLLRRLLIDRLIVRVPVLDRKCDKAKGEKPVLFNSKDDYMDDLKWNAFVDQLDDYQAGLFRTLKNDLVSAVTDDLPSKDWYTETQVWDTCKQGEILMADKGSKETINIVNGVLTRTTNNDGFTDQLTEQLRNC